MSNLHHRHAFPHNNDCDSCVAKKPVRDAWSVVLNFVHVERGVCPVQPRARIRMDGKTVIRRVGGASGEWGEKIKRAESLGGEGAFRGRAN